MMPEREQEKSALAWVRAQAKAIDGSVEEQIGDCTRLIASTIDLHKKPSVSKTGWIPINRESGEPNFPREGIRVAIFSPCYTKKSTMDRIRIVDSQFVRICSDATHWAELTEPDGVIQ